MYKWQQETERAKYITREWREEKKHQKKALRVFSSESSVSSARLSDTQRRISAPVGFSAQPGIFTTTRPFHLFAKFVFFCRNKYKWTEKFYKIKTPVFFARISQVVSLTFLRNNKSSAIISRNLVFFSKGRVNSNMFLSIKQILINLSQCNLWWDCWHYFIGMSTLNVGHQKYLFCFKTKKIKELMFAFAQSNEPPDTHPDNLLVIEKKKTI